MGICVDTHTALWVWVRFLIDSLICQSKFQATFKAQCKRSCLQKALFCPPMCQTPTSYTRHVLFKQQVSFILCSTKRPGRMRNEGSVPKSAAH